MIYIIEHIAFEIALALYILGSQRKEHDVSTYINVKRQASSQRGDKCVVNVGVYHMYVLCT